MLEDAHGRWRGVALNARGKTEARFLANELQQRTDRMRMAIEPASMENGSGTGAELIGWWLDSYSKGTPSYSRDASFVRRHLVHGAAGDGAREGDPAAVDALSKDKEATLAPTA